MTGLSRFEKKILAAIAAVALMPLLGTLILGQAVLREAYQVGVNPRVREELNRELAIYRQHFVELRQSAEQIADAVSGDWRLRKAVGAGDSAEATRLLQERLARYPSLARVLVRNSDGATLARAELSDRLNPAAMRLLELNRSMRELPKAPQVVVTVAAPVAAFQAFERAGELVEVYSRLEAGGGFVSRIFLVVYLVFLLSVVAVAVAMGIAISRRVTRRVVQLVDATAKVGAGDLSVEVPSDQTDEIGELTRAFNAMVRDIRESRGRIEYLQRISAWQEFARRLAHEIKNPLTPIQLAVQEVHRSYKGDDRHYQHKLTEALSIVEEEIATLRHLVGEFSSFARLPQARLSSADLNDFVRDAARSLGAGVDGQPEDKTSGPAIEVQLELSDQPLPVRIDSMMLKRCLDNLVRNSREAILHAARDSGESQDGGGCIRIRTLRQADYAVIEVDDNGPGILPQYYNKVFDPYYSTKKEGTGLGLAIVKKVILEHGGEIDCTNSDLGGASFRIQFPISFHGVQPF